MSCHRGWDQSGYKKECVKWVQLLIKRVSFRCRNASALVQNFLDLKLYLYEEIDICVSTSQKEIDKKEVICAE